MNSDHDPPLRRPSTQEDALKRINAQMANTERIKHAHVLLANHGTAAATQATSVFKMSCYICIQNVFSSAESGAKTFRNVFSSAQLRSASRPTELPAERPV
jgi:hypothetical protein